MATSQMSTVIQHLRKAVLLRDGAGMTDGQLLGCFIEHRDEAAFAALVQRHGPMVWGVCRRVLPNHDDAEDAFQATFLVLVRKAVSVVPREMVANWLYGVARQTAWKAREMSARRKARERQVTNMPEPAVVEQDLWRDLQPLLDQELGRLPDKYRVAIVLCDLEGKTRKETARQLGLPEGTLSARLARARTMLAKRLARHGLALSGGALAVLVSQNAASAGVPASVVFATVEAAALIAAGQAAAAGVISTKVAALTDGVLKAMLVTKLKVTAMVLLVIGAAVMGTGALVHPSLADTAADRTAVAVEQPGAPQAVERQETADEEAQQPRGQAKGEATFPGTLQSVDVAKNTVTVKGGTNIRQTGPIEKTFKVAKDIVILRDDKSAKLSDLKQGGRVTVKLSPDQKTAVSISETGKMLAGPLKSVDPANNTITITVAGGREGLKKDVAHQLAKDGKVTLAGKEAKLADLKDLRPGSTVQLTFSVDDDKKLVHIQYAARNR